MLLPGFKAAGRNSGADRHLPGSRQQHVHGSQITENAFKTAQRIFFLRTQPTAVLRQKYQAVRHDLQAGRFPRCFKVPASMLSGHIWCCPEPIPAGTGNVVFSSISPMKSAGFLPYRREPGVLSGKFGRNLESGIGASQDLL